MTDESNLQSLSLELNPGCLVSMCPHCFLISSLSFNIVYPLPYYTADFAIVSHNILGDHNASKHRDLYTNIQFDYMKWDRRKELIFQDIYQWNADIVCLQVSLIKIC